MAKGGRFKSASKQKVTINYLKTPNYRTYFIDGMYGGITPNGKIFAELFIQRNPTPKTVTQEINEDGSMGKIEKSEGKKGLIRQVEASLLMDIETAKSFAGWLNDKIKKHEVLFHGLSAKQ